jgi:predicted ester cyclase
MSFEENRGVIQRFVDGFNQGDQAVFRQLMAEEYYNYAPKAGEEKANELFGRLARDLRAALPDLQITAEEFSGEGDELTFNLTLKGTHTAGLWGAPPTEQEVGWTSTASCRFVNGKFAVNWPDLPIGTLLRTMRQVNLVPPPEDMDKPHQYPVSLPEMIVKVLFTGQVADKPCTHLDQIQVVEPDEDVCEQCVAMGDIWPALRMCLTCGFIGCCDTSKNKHAKAHFEETGHPLIRSIRLEESWIWCYEDAALFSGKILDNYR